MLLLQGLLRTGLLRQWHSSFERVSVNRLGSRVKRATSSLADTGKDIEPNKRDQIHIVCYSSKVRALPFGSAVTIFISKLSAGLGLTLGRGIATTRVGLAAGSRAADFWITLQNTLMALQHSCMAPEASTAAIPPIIPQASHAPATPAPTHRPVRPMTSANAICEYLAHTRNRICWRP